jgi:hypothetical protein
MGSRKLTLQCIALAIVAGVLVGGAVASASSSPGGSGKTATHIKRYSIDASLMRRFGLFRKVRARTAGAAASEAVPALPAAVVKGFADPELAEHQYGADVSATAYEHPKGDFGFWVVPGSSGACLVWNSGGVLPGAHAGCAPSGGVSAHGMLRIDYSYGAPVIFGLEPDGVTSVTVTNTDGGKISAAVANNVFALTGASGNSPALFTSGSTNGSSATISVQS